MGNAGYISARPTGCAERGQPTRANGGPTGTPPAESHLVPGGFLAGPRAGGPHLERTGNPQCKERSTDLQPLPAFVLSPIQRRGGPRRERGAGLKRARKQDRDLSHDQKWAREGG
jgi:hypothetical protein